MMLHPVIEKIVMEKALLARLLEERRQAQAQAEQKAMKKQKAKARRKQKATSSTDF